MKVKKVSILFLHICHLVMFSVYQYEEDYDTSVKTLLKYKLLPVLREIILLNFLRGKTAMSFKISTHKTCPESGRSARAPGACQLCICFAKLVRS